MHEFGLCEAVVQTIERRAEGRRVDHVRLRVGVLNRVVEDAFTQAFEMVAAGSVAASAQVELVHLPVEATCKDCGAATSSMDELPACTDCGSVVLDVTGGHELIVESLTYAPGAVARGDGATDDDGS